VTYDLTPSRQWLVFAACLLVCFGVWRWAERILVPANTFAAEAKRVPIGNNSDLYPRWYGAHELLLHHRSPYSTQVTREIQQGFYGRELDSRNPNDPTDQVAFAYPVYLVFLLAPTLNWPFTTVQVISRWLACFGIAATVPAWMYAIGIRTKPVFVLSGMVLAISTYPAVLEFHMQNLAALVAILLAAAAVAATRNYFSLSGFFLALSTIKPQLSVLFVLCFLVWVIARWRERKGLVLSFAVTTVGLVIAGEAVLPHWIPQFVRAVRAYGIYTTDPSILQFIFGPTLSWAVAAALCGALLIVSWRYSKCAAGSRTFGWLLASAATVTLAISPVTAYNQVLLVAPLLFLFFELNSIAGPATRALTKATFACLGWQWFSAVILAVCSLFVAPERLYAFARVPVWTLIALPPVTLLAIAASASTLQLKEPGPQDLAAPHV